MRVDRQRYEGDDEMIPKTWREVELRREYLRGWRDGWKSSGNRCDYVMLSTICAELTSLEALKPCIACRGRGGHDADDFEMHEVGGGRWRSCGPCSGSGIEGGPR
jgi:hypothetical protein